MADRRDTEPGLSTFLSDWQGFLRKHDKVDIRRHAALGRLELTYTRRNGLMGRFGGGWNWKVGVMVGGSTWIISLLIVDVRIYWRPKAKGGAQ